MRASQFNANGDIVQIPASASLALENCPAHTLLLWAMVENTTSTFAGRLCQHGDQTIRASPQWSLTYTPSTGQLVYNVIPVPPGPSYGMNTPLTHFLSISGGVPAFQWLFVAVAADVATGEASNWRLMVGTATWPAREPASYTSHGPIAASVGPSGAHGDTYLGNRAQSLFPLLGRIGFFGVWNRVLSIAEIQDLQRDLRVTRGCVCFMPLGAADVQLDLSDYGNHGRALGSVQSVPGVPWSIPAPARLINNLLLARTVIGPLAPPAGRLYWDDGQFNTARLGARTNWDATTRQFTAQSGARVVWDADAQQFVER